MVYPIIRIKRSNILFVLGCFEIGLFVPKHAPKIKFYIMNYDI